MKIDSGMMNKPVYTDAVVARPKVEPQQAAGEVNVQPMTTNGAAKVAPVATEAQAHEQAGNEENTSRRIKSAVDHANQTMRHAKTKCEFSYHEETKRVSIKVIDEETEEVIREIPPEEALEMLSKMWELAGLMVDEKR